MRIPARAHCLRRSAAMLTLALIAATAQGAPKGTKLSERCQAYSGLPHGFEAKASNGANMAGLVHVKGGRFMMGAQDGYPEERPVHEAVVDDFWIDRHEVTNAQFARFVKATSYVTVAEREQAQAQSGMAEPGSAVFKQPAASPGGGWTWVTGANWRHPGGPDTDLDGLENHPVVHIAYEDALAYARWLGRDLPTEAQWEYAARGGLEGQSYPWGNTPDVNGRLMANTGQGAFPLENLAQDGYQQTAPVGCFPDNGYGLWDVVGNVWELTRDVFRATHAPQDAPDVLTSLNADRRAASPAAHVIKGGSFLCASNYCVRYRSASRQPLESGLATNHVGFRTVFNP